MNLPYILNIQKYSIHDGPGIRTTIFLKVVYYHVYGVIIQKVKVMRENLCIMLKFVNNVWSV